MKVGLFAANGNELDYTGYKRVAIRSFVFGEEVEPIAFGVNLDQKNKHSADELRFFNDEDEEVFAVPIVDSLLVTFNMQPTFPAGSISIR
jgi:hypothetical protein